MVCTQGKRAIGTIYRMNRFGNYIIILILSEHHQKHHKNETLQDRMSTTAPRCPMVSFRSPTRSQQVGNDKSFQEVRSIYISIYSPIGSSFCYSVDSKGVTCVPTCSAVFFNAIIFEEDQFPSLSHMSYITLDSEIPAQLSRRTAYDPSGTNTAKI